jgi:helicase
VTCVQDKNAYICERLEQILKVPENSALIFTYTKDDVKRLAQHIGSNVAPLLGSVDSAGSNKTWELQAKGVGYFHSGLTLQQRNANAEAYHKNLLRVVVATTSLKMGVNLPATHVFIRDHLFWGKGHLSITDILQMLGRAGRGNVSGHGEVLVDEVSIGERYAEKLRSMSLPPLEPRMFAASSTDAWRRGEQDREEEERILQVLVLIEIVACGRTSGTKIEAFLRSTFSGFVFGFHGNVQSVLQQLQQWHLIEPVEGAEDLHKPRPLGRTTCLTGLHPQTGAALGGFLVALIRLGEKEKEKDPSKDSNYLSRLTELDFLFMVCACIEMRRHLLRPPSKNRIATIQDYIEQLDPDDKPVVNLWRSESNPDRSPGRLLGSLKVKIDSERKGVAEKKFYQFMDAATLLHRHSRGKTLAELVDLYQVDEGRLEQGLKSTSLWLLSGLAQICDSRKCYKLDSLMLRILELMEKVRYGSGLGSLLKLEGIGKKTIEKLIASGFREPKDLQATNKTELVSCGIGQKQAEKILRVAQKARR